MYNQSSVINNATTNSKAIKRKAQKPKNTSTIKRRKLAQNGSKSSKAVRSGKQNIRHSNKINKRPKTWEEVAYLERQFKLDPAWCRKTVQECKKFLKLRTDQIYKWGYDKKKAIEKEKFIDDSDTSNLLNDFPSLCTNAEDLDLNEEVEDLLNFKRKRSLKLKNKTELIEAKTPRSHNILNTTNFSDNNKPDILYPKKASSCTVLLKENLNLSESVQVESDIPKFLSDLSFAGDYLYDSSDLHFNDMSFWDTFNRDNGGDLPELNSQTFLSSS